MPAAQEIFDGSTDTEPTILAQDGIKLHRSVVHRELTGDMIGKSEAQRAAACTATLDSAGYVAVERFTCSVRGKSGSFVLQHRGLMENGESALMVKSLPDSGTGELDGISGRLEIDNEEGKRSYAPEYEHQ